MTDGSRFVPTRAGIINLWDYRDQEFSFADGRLVLRGPNGSGKTKALEVLFPFVFDGRIEPRRLNPFAGEERTMKSNLLYRKQDSAYSYVWMEFARGQRSDPEAVTIGIGMRATRSSDKVTRWYFVVDGRVGVDFSLLGPDDRPFTRKQLADEVGGDSITDRPVDYRAAIDSRMFGLGQQRFDQLINLILTLRRPQLAKNLDPKGLSQALTDGLRPLDEQLVTDAARSFSDMEEVGRSLEGLVQADTATRKFVSVYTRYLGVQAKTDVDQVQRRLTTVDHSSTALFAARQLRERRRDERIAAEQRLEAADRALDQALSDRDALHRSSAYEGKQQLDDLADAVRRLETSTRQQEDKAVKAREVASQRAAESERAATAARSTAVRLSRAEDELLAAAEDAGITWSPLPAHVRADQLTAAIRGHAEERDGDVLAVRTALAAVDTASSERVRADRAAARARELRDAATAAVAEAEAAVELARAETAHALRRWWEQHGSTFDEVRDGLFDSLATALGNAGDDDAVALAEVLAERVEPLVESTRALRHEALGRTADASAQVRARTAERSEVAAERDDAPPPFAARTQSRKGLTGAPLWQLVRFADSVADADAAGIEAALHAANILDGWISDTPPHDIDSEQFLVALPLGKRPRGRTLADVLVVEDNTAVPRELVAAVLASISIDDVNAAVRIGVDGRFAQGVSQGRHRKSDAEFIGATARAHRRSLRLAELDGLIAEAEAHEQAASSEAAGAGDRLAQIASATKALPRVTAVTAALRKVAEAAVMLRSRSETAGYADRELDQAVADLSLAEKRLRTTSVERRAPRRARELDALAAAIRHFENTGSEVMRSRSEHDRATEREREAADRNDDAVALAEELAIEAAEAQEGYSEQQHRLETLRESLGASAKEIDAELERARLRIDACKSEQRAARKADREAGEAVGKADGADQTAIEGLRIAFTEIVADAKRLAPYAHRDILSLLGAAAETRWPSTDAAWSSVEQMMSATEAAGPHAAPQILPPEVLELFENLSTATESVRISDAARKTTRSAVTAALQDFDAQLAKSGQEFALRWDDDDGLTVVQVVDEQGSSSIADFAERIDRARREQETLLTDAERRILEDALLTGLAQQIHERTVDARDLIARMGAEMKQRRMSSGNTIGVHWVLADTLSDHARSVSKLLDRDASMLGHDELATIRAHFASEIRAARAAHPERSYPEILSTTLDYRRWRVFSFTLISGDGTEERLTVARHSALSGGEQSVSLHLPLFAAAHVMLDSADPQAPRLLALDEAFAGVDDNGRSELLGLSVQFDLDLFMTGYDLWITYADVPGCAHYDLAHSAAENTVSATLLVWEDGELLAEHDGSDLAAALGSPGQRRVPRPVEGGLDFA